MFVSKSKFGSGNSNHDERFLLKSENSENNRINASKIYQKTQHFRE